MRNLIVIAFVFLNFFAAACSSEPGPVHMTEVECRLNSDCAVGEYCDSFTSLCGWDCRDDSECELGMYCRLDTGRCEREDVPPIDPGPVLEIVAGNLEDAVVMGGTSDAEILRFDIVNRSDRDMILGMVPAGFAHEDGTPAEAGSFTDVKFVDRADLYTLKGPQDLNPAVGANLYFDEEVPLPAGETTTLVLRADLGGSGRYLVTVGALVALLEDVAYADTLERVPPEEIRGNRILGRVIEVQPVEEMTADGSVLLYTFEGRGGNRSERDAFHPLGTLTLTAFGGPVDFEGVTMSGLPFEGFEGLALSNEVTLEGPLVSSIGSFIDLRLTTPIRIVEGESISYEVWGMLTPASRGFEFTMNVIGLDANPVGDASLTIARMGDGSPTRIRVWTAYPIITRQTLSTTTLTNGVQQDLYKVQIGSSEAEAVRVGSLTFHLSGLDTGRTFTNFRVRRGSTEIAPGDYRVIRTYDGTDLENGTLEGFLTAQVTVIFDTRLEISGSGQTITLMATPNGFVAGDSITVGFGDRHGTYDTMNGVLNADGTLSFPEVFGDASWVDCVAWSDTGVRWTGTWGLETLSEFETLTR